jgi:hypothetical protein
MPETLQLSKPDLVQRAPKQMEDEPFCVLHEAGIQKLQNLLMSRIAKF